MSVITMRSSGNGSFSMSSISDRLSAFSKKIESLGRISMADD